MSLTYKTKAFILHQEDSGEADRILSLYTKDYGLIEVVAKGERKLTSKLRAFLQPFSLCDIEFVQGKNAKTVINSQVVEDFYSVKKDLQKLVCATNISNIILKTITDSQKDENIWSLILITFSLLDKITNETDIKILYYFFVIKLLSLTGYHIDIFKCSVCGEKLSKECYISFGDKNVVCFNCRKSSKDNVKIDFETMIVLKYILRSQIQALLGLPLKENHFKKLDLISKQYIEI